MSATADRRFAPKADVEIATEIESEVERLLALKRLLEQQALEAGDQAYRLGRAATALRAPARTA
jgi:hypothetical protein